MSELELKIEGVSDDAIRLFNPVLRMEPIEVELFKGHGPRKYFLPITRVTPDIKNDDPDVDIRIAFSPGFCIDTKFHLPYLFLVYIGLRKAGKKVSIMAPAISGQRIPGDCFNIYPTSTHKSLSTLFTAFIEKYMSKNGEPNIDVIISQSSGPTNVLGYENRDITRVLLNPIMPTERTELDESSAMFKRYLLTKLPLLQGYPLVKGSLHVFISSLFQKGGLRCSKELAGPYLENLLGNPYNAKLITDFATLGAKDLYPGWPNSDVCLIASVTDPDSGSMVKSDKMFRIPRTGIINNCKTYTPNFIEGDHGGVVTAPPDACMPVDSTYHILLYYNLAVKPQVLKSARLTVEHILRHR